MRLFVVSRVLQKRGVGLCGWPVAAVLRKEFPAVCAKRRGVKFAL